MVLQAHKSQLSSPSRPWRFVVLTSMLGRRGIASKVVIGVETGAEFSAHAWVESGDRALLRPLDQSHRLVEL